jgi:hypothetical protein
MFAKTAVDQLDPIIQQLVVKKRSLNQYCFYIPCNNFPGLRIWEEDAFDNQMASIMKEYVGTQA